MLGSPVKYRCKGCGHEAACNEFGYLGWSTIRCCPECSSTVLVGVMRDGTLQ